MSWPGWPSERQWVTIGIYAMGMTMLFMGAYDKTLWNVELFKVIIQGVVLSGLINMVLAFHFAANKNDETKTENTRAAFEAITATANATNAPASTAAADAAQDTADAAQAKADAITAKVE